MKTIRSWFRIYKHLIGRSVRKWTKITEAYFRYTKTVLRHKKYVFVECCKLGIPIAGFFHDFSKFLPSEFIAYARHFELCTGDENDYKFAWLLHQHRNPHHWQFYILHNDDGTIEVLEMPDRYRKEMLADWIGAGKTYGNDDTAGWYLKHRHMLLGFKTRRWIETQLKLPYTEISNDELKKLENEILTTGQNYVQKKLSKILREDH